MTEDMKTISRRIVEEGFAGGNLDVMDKLVAENHVNHDQTVPPEMQAGREGLKRLAQTYRVAFPDLELTVEDQIAEGDKVVTRWSARGTHRGDLLGIPPTGKQGRAGGITIDRIEQGRVVESWNSWDQLALLQQLGVIPEMAQT